MKKALTICFILITQLGTCQETPTSDQTISKITEQISKQIRSEFRQKNNESIIGKHYEFTEETNVFEHKIKFDLTEKKTLSTQDIELNKGYIFNNKLLLAKVGWVFTVVKNLPNKVIIQIINKKEYIEKFYSISKEKLKKNSQIYNGDKPKRSFVSSAITIPIKVRFGDNKEHDEKKKYFDFEGNTNVGITAGFRDRINNNGKNYISYLGGLSIASAKITPETAEIDSETNASILTPFLGILYEYDDFQIGTFVGWDHIGGKLGKSWVYQGNAWIGFGIGYNIFTSKDSNGS
ncbi:hypothetical protein [Aquimarina sp. I32.4]|uniref:hypothetical protein n=1 Tax=Aquimarina sp. I32.4 TaxID=2053903 RepID=UPI000CDED2CB|nr:hypothetical protein [Aquimarina sp. I32.4]